MGLFVFWIVVFPFILLYGAYEGPKIWWLWMGGLVLSLWWIIQQKMPRKSWFMNWICVLLLASFVGVHPVESMIGSGYRHQGILFFLTLFLIGETLPFLSAQWKKILTAFLMWGVVFESVIVILQKISTWGERPLGTFGEPNAVAGFLALGVFWLWKTKKISGVFLVCTAIAATGSRTGMIAALIVLGGFIIQKKYVLIAAGLIAACAILFVSRPASLYENRPLFWTMAAKAIAHRPILGYGAETSEVVFNETFARENIRLFDLTVDRSHNIFLDVAMWSGLVGLFVFGRWIWEIFRQSKIPWVFAAWFLFACFQPVGVVHWVQLMVLLAADDHAESIPGGS